MSIPTHPKLRSKWWRLQHLYKIVDKNADLTRFILNPSQLRIREAILPSLKAGLPLRHYDLKCRQSGVSTFWLLYYLDEAIFHPNTFVGIQAQEQQTLDFLWEVVRRAHETMPNSLRPELRKDNAKTLSIAKTNSRVVVSLRVLSTTLHKLHISEYPLCNPDDIKQTIAACPPNADITLEGVPAGVNHAHSKWLEVKQPDSDYTHTFHPWFLQREYRDIVVEPLEFSPEEQRIVALAETKYGAKLDGGQILFRRRMRRELGSQFQEQYAEDDDTCFMESGLHFFDNPKVTRLLQEAIAHNRSHPPVFRTPEIDQWETPQDRHLYAAGADVAEGGVAGDWSVLTIFCTTCRQQAFRYRARVNVDKFAEICDSWGRKFNNAKLAVERNNHGHAVLLWLSKKLHYPNLYTEEKQRLISTAKKSTYIDTKYGWETDSQSRPIMLQSIKLAIEGKFDDGIETFETEFKVFDELFLREALTFNHVDSKRYEAAQGYHDDLVMSWAIAYQVYVQVKARVYSDDFGIKVGVPRET